MPCFIARQLLYTNLGQENLLLDLVTYRKVRTEVIVVLGGSCLCICCWMIDDVFVSRGELDLSIRGTSVALFTVRLTRLNHKNDRRSSCCFYMQFLVRESHSMLLNVTFGICIENVKFSFPWKLCLKSTASLAFSIISSSQLATWRVEFRLYWALSDSGHHEDWVFWVFFASLTLMLWL